MPHRTAAKSATPKNLSRSGKKAVQPGRGKGETILGLIGRAKGTTLSELMKATGRQAATVRGFISITAKKHGIKIESVKNDAGERVYCTR